MRVKVNIKKCVCHALARPLKLRPIVLIISNNMQDTKKNQDKHTKMKANTYGRAFLRKGGEGRKEVGQRSRDRGGKDIRK